MKSTELLHWRQNSGSLFMGKRKVNLGPAGLPDIVVVVPPTGRFVGLEVKSKVGKLRPKQVTFMKKILSVGGSYYIVRSLTEAKNAVAAELGKCLLK